MKRSKRLGTVLQIAEQRKHEAEQALGNAQQRLEQERLKLQQLQDYLAEYQQSQLARGQQGVSIEVLRRMQLFKDRLQVAIDQQRQQIVVAEFNLQQARHSWQAAHGRHRAIGALRERVADQEQRQADKQLQTMIDEMAAARRHYQR
ncbi:flagellar export protein FliJ [Motiliproteus sediminis]|uniref:flagellar export protein FliJ n=1 Tax=Motiliproteus sediminis TaxID=1468178 RepID=UPI001AEF7660|nr:flagellar export protein FliJ [Motiliproteus sediminis]